MMQTAAHRYQEVQANTSNPGELLIALYDGLFRFLKGARVCLERGDKARGGELLSKAYSVVSELYIALDHDVNPELCANLEGVYGFCMDKITFANLKGSPEVVDEVIRVLTPLREAWAVAVVEAQKEKANK